MKLLSIDTETTGLEENCYLIQFGMIPLDTDTKQTVSHLAREYCIKCPSYEELRPNLTEWVREHNELLIRYVHANGISLDEFRREIKEYLEHHDVKNFFGNEKPVLLGKSLSALDIRVLQQTLGIGFVEKYFHHHTIDITSVARFLVDAKLLPDGCQSTTKIINHFGIRCETKHTALFDAMDMANVYLRLLDVFRKPVR